MERQKREGRMLKMGEGRGEQRRKRREKKVWRMIFEVRRTNMIVGNVQKSLFRCYYVLKVPKFSARGGLHVIIAFKRQKYYPFTSFRAIRMDDKFPDF